MADVYLALLGVEFTVAVFLAGGVAAVAQVIATQVSQGATGLLWRSRPLRMGVLLLAGSILWSLGVAALLQDGSLASTRPEAGAPVAITTGLIVALSVLMLGRALTSAVRLLDPLEAVRRLLADADGSAWARYVVGARAGLDLTHEDRAAAAEGLRLDRTLIMMSELLPDAVASPGGSQVSEAVPVASRVTSSLAAEEFLKRLSERRDIRKTKVGLQQAVRSGTLTDPLGPAFEVVGRSVARDPDPEFAALLGRVMDRNLAMLETATCEGVTAAEVHLLLTRALFEDHVGPLVRSALDVGRLRHAASASRVAAAPRRSGQSIEVNAAAFTVTHSLARSLVDAHAAGPLSSVIADMATLAIAVGGMKGGLVEHRFDEICRGLGELGQRIPRAFSPPGESAATIGPHARELETAAPLGALLSATWEIKENLFQTAGRGPSPLVWVAALKVTAQEVARYSASVLHANHLEDELCNAIEQIADLGIRGARAGEKHWASVAGRALIELARDAEDAIWSEYPEYLAVRLAEIAVFAFDQGIREVSYGRNPLGEELAQAIADDLRATVHHVADEVRRGRFDDASQEANDKLLAALRVPS